MMKRGCMDGSRSAGHVGVEAVWFERDAVGSSLVRVRPPFIPATENEPAAHRAATKAFAVANRNVSGMAGFGDNVDHTSETTLYRCAYLFQSVGPLGQQLGLNLEAATALLCSMLHSPLTRCLPLLLHRIGDGATIHNKQTKHTRSFYTFRREGDTIYHTWGAIGGEGTTEEWGFLGNAGVAEAVMLRQITERQGRAHGHAGGSQGSGQYLYFGELTSWQRKQLA